MINIMNTLITSENIAIASVSLTILTFIGLLLYGFMADIKISLNELIIRSLSASALPNAIVIIICAFDTTLLGKLAGLFQVYIALAGLSLIYVSINGIFTPNSNI
jgi:hypothetical protein